MNLVSETRKVVFALAAAGESFTAYDVTLKVRDVVGRSESVDHQDVNGIVRTMFLGQEISGYDRNLDYSLGANPAPYRYAPLTATQPAVVSSPVVAQAQPAVVSAPAPVAASNETRLVRILKKDVVAAGFTAGDKVGVSYLPALNRLFVYPADAQQVVTNDPEAQRNDYSVGSKFDIRIPLTKFGANDVIATDVKVNAKVIEVELKR